MVSKYLAIPPRREVIIKSEEETDFSYGWLPEERPPEILLKYSVINLDKPIGPSSHEVVAWLQRQLGIQKIAHAGTLDPKVSGILTITIGNSLRILPILLKEDKEYVCVMRLHGDVEKERLEKVVNLFKGKIYQRPPLRSAVKRTLRIRQIYDIKILEFSGRTVLLQIWCEAGTYMRKLCHDIGEILGVGAHMQELRRIRSGSLTEENHLATLHDVVDAYFIWKQEGIDALLRDVFLSVERAIQHLPKVWIRDSAVDAICHGAPLAAPGIVKLESGIKVGTEVAIMTLKNELVAVGSAKMTTEKMLSVNSGEAVRPKYVVMDPGTYPKMWKTKQQESRSAQA